MPHHRRAVIDVGTNSVKLLVADVSANHLRPVLEDSKQTRLGQGFYENHQLQPGPIAKTAEAVSKFADAARDLQVSSIHVIATSAARDAVNAQQLISAIETATGLKVDIISGDREAELAFHGVTSDPELAKDPLLILDVGGGSTEFILGQGEHKHFRESFPLGSVRLLEKFPHSDPPAPDQLAACREWLKNFLKSEVQPKLETEMHWETQVYSVKNHIQLVGTGGTASILARIEMKLEDFDRDRIEAARIGLDSIKRHVAKLWSLPLAERQKMVGLPPKRADVILTGALIYEAVMEQFGFEELRVSTRGLRFAAVMEGHWLAGSPTGRQTLKSAERPSAG